jgi:hypothetical protein
MKCFGILGEILLKTLTARVRKRSTPGDDKKQMLEHEKEWIVEISENPDGE